MLNVSSAKKSRLGSSQEDALSERHTMWKEKWDGLVWRSIFNDEKQRVSLFKFHRAALQVRLVLFLSSNCWIFLPAPALIIVGCFSGIWKAPFSWIFFCILQQLRFFHLTCHETRIRGKCDLRYHSDSFECECWRIAALCDFIWNSPIELVFIHPRKALKMVLFTPN